MRRVLAVLLSATIASTLLAAPAAGDVRATARYLDAVRGDALRLGSFLRAMPKGGDIHHHLAGAVYAESLVGFAARDGLCIDEATLAASPPPCGAGKRPARDAIGSAAFYQRILAAWSMRGFTPGEESGHDHFFNTFGLFGAATIGHGGEMLAEAAERAAAQNVFYLETLITPELPAVRALGLRTGFDRNFARMRARLRANGAMAAIVAAARRRVSANDRRFRARLRCGTRRARAGCRIPYRFQYQVLRAQPPEVVFSQLVLGFELMQRDRRFVAVNLVQPEDDIVSLRDYTLHMEMIRFLRRIYPRGHVTLHAGELAPGIAPPEDLRFHIRQAISIAGAERIGHGVDIAHEDGAPGLLRRMARERIPVEILLTSNRQILEVSGRRHPLRLYLRAGVPVALSTDDEGVSRSDITEQYEQAVVDHGLGYAQLKPMSRDALEYGFIQGRSLWRTRRGYVPVAACAGVPLGAPRPGPRCARFLAGSPKATAQWRQERAFRLFEARFRR